MAVLVVGPSGSGKSHTIFGTKSPHQNKWKRTKKTSLYLGSSEPDGILPRSLRHFLDKAAADVEKGESKLLKLIRTKTNLCYVGITWEILVSCLEIQQQDLDKEKTVDILSGRSVILKPSSTGVSIQCAAAPQPAAKKPSVPTSKLAPYIPATGLE